MGRVECETLQDRRNINLEGESRNTKKERKKVQQFHRFNLILSFIRVFQRNKKKKVTGLNHQENGFSELETLSLCPKAFKCLHHWIIPLHF